MCLYTLHSGTYREFYIWGYLQNLNVKSYFRRLKLFCKIEASQTTLVKKNNFFI